MARYTKLIIILFLSLVTFGANAKSPPPGTGTSDVPANIMIMLDNSGSMRANVTSAGAVYYPTDVQTDSSGNVYILSYSYNQIKKYDTSGNFVKSIGGGGYGCNQWYYAYDFEIFNDQIYIYSRYGRDIKVMDLNGNCVRNTSRNVLKSNPWSIAITNDYIYIKYNYQQIDRFNRSNLSFAGSQTFPRSVHTYGYGAFSANNAGTKLIAANRNNPIYGLTEWNIGGGGALTFAGHTCTSYSSSNGCHRYANGADYDSSGNIYSTDYYNHRVQKFNSSYQYRRKQGSYYGSNGYFYPYGIHVDKNDKIYVANYYRHQVLTLDTSLSPQGKVGGASTRMDVSHKVIKQIVSNTDLTSGANFGLMEWGTRHRIRVKISDTGAKKIYNDVSNIYASGGTNLRQALTIVRSHFKTAGNVPNFGKTCARNYLIVISDGYWSSHSSVLSIADQMNKVDNIQTFAVGLGVSHSNYVQLAQKGGTKTPLYASNAADLLNKLTDAIKQAISGRLTFTTPAIMSDVTKGDFIYQSTFKYEKDMQWKGNLKKYKLKADGTFDAEQWDAATKLNSKSASSRNIWTIGLTNKGINNFTTTNRDELKTRLFANAQSAPTDTQVDNLINFIRGVDTYDQDADKNTTEEIHKLADIYNSDLIVVGKPDASITDTGNTNFNKTDAYYRVQNGYNNFKSNKCGSKNCADRTEVVIAGANNGILHAFKSSDGEELWGYIPPFIFENLERIPSSKANTTNAVYGVDGSPVVKDIYFDDTPNDGSNNPRWRTILISGVGAGGKGIFALDITDIDNPKHLFAIQNDSTNQIVNHWNIDENLSQYGYGSGSIAAEFDYRKLGETWSTPRIIKIKVSGTEKWVAVFGGGYNGATNPDYGSAVFVVDIENEGKLLKKIDITDSMTTNYTWSGSIQNNHSSLYESNKKMKFKGGVSPNICYDTSKGESLTSKFSPNRSHQVYYTSSGTTYCVDYVEFTGAWPAAYSANAPYTSGTWTFTKQNNEIVNSLPADLRVITANGTDKADYIGAMVYASDIEGKITKINLTDVGTLYDTTTFFNVEATSSNGRYLYKSAEATFNNDGKLWLYFGTGNTQKLQEQSNSIQNRIYGIKDLDFPRFSQITKNTVAYCTNSSCPTAHQGWYVNLTSSRKLTAEPTIDKDRVYFPIYEPTSGVNACKTGKAILTGYDALCGKSVLTVEVGTGVLSKVIVRKDRLYVGLSGEAKNNVSGFTQKDNLLSSKSGAQSTGKQVQIEFWKENY
jgi:type IV pilus assembly protein PilY1